RVVQAAEGSPHVAVDGDDLFAKELLETLAVRAPQRAERLARRDVVPEARRGRRACLRPDDEIDALDLGIAIEEHPPEDLPEEPGPAEDDEVRSAKDVRDVEHRRLRARAGGAVAGAGRRVRAAGRQGSVRHRRASLTR